MVAGAATLGWAFAYIREGQVQSRGEIDRLNGALARMQTLLQQRSGASASDASAERQVIGRATQAARAEAHDQVMAELAEHELADEAPARRAPRITFEDSRQRVQSAFATEAVDASWASEAEHKLEGIVRGHLPTGSRLSGLACHASMCEVDVTHADSKAQADFLLTGFTGWPGSLFVAGETPQHGEVAVTIFAAREGTELPIAPR